ncbi:histidine phosphatase family protein [Streptantibioticus silvisoli]|uniref:Histidine phosphatase family protein n=1 Tax=Streptantibioticus silvisoli TaxID=2705255 RepID=A0ABT6VZW0_9ACTN|nr:histidine phosphatase family protein [Streptantibioticus silvisoli]MDI5964033.1 histidine phosphatase family protein [Streptantibioticus silvisoli]
MEHVGATPGMAAVYAVRHGQSVANVLFAEAVRAGDGAGGGGPVVAGGDAAVPLSGAGREQAAGLRAWVRGAGIDLVVTSPYARARQTWELMAGESTAPVVVDERLRDRETGVFELMTPAAVAARAPQESARRELLGDWYYRPPGGESLADVVLRVRDFVRDASTAAAGHRVLVVAHDAVVLSLRHVFDGFGAPLPDPALAVPNASVSHWVPDGSGGMRLASFGVTRP